MTRDAEGRTTAAPDSLRQVGSPHPSLHSRRLVAGKGAYVADMLPDGLLHMVVLRSPFAHAWIRGVDASRASNLPGVVDVILGDEIRSRTNPIPEGWDTAAVGARQSKCYALCIDRARYVGEAVAAIVAESRYAADLAREQLEVDYEPLTPVTDAVQALDPNAPLVEPEWGTNVLAERKLETGDVTGAMAQADGVLEGRLSTQRTTGVPIETRGVLAHYDPDRGSLTIWDSTQNPHPLRVYLAETLGLDESRIRVIQPDVGGAFGLKQPTSQEEPLVAYASLKLGRPVRWIEERSENFQATGHAKEMIAEYRVAFTSNGRLTALDVEILADVGAPSSLVGWGMTFTASGLVPGAYKVPNTRVRLRTVVTNKCPWNAYRGFGKDVANLWLERIVDHVARELGMDPAEVRRRNFIQPDEFPYQSNAGGVVDSGNYEASLDRVLDLIGYEDFPEEQRLARSQGRRIGLGFGHELSPEGCAMPGSVMVSAYDGATVRIDPSGQVSVLSGVTSPGNGNETALAQIAAEMLGCDLDAIRVVQGDTLVCPWGLGNYSSRGVIIGGSAVYLAASQLRDKLLQVAGSMLEVDPLDLDLAEGRFSLRGAPSRLLAFQAVVDEIYKRPYGRHAGSVEAGLEATRYFRAPNVYHQPAKQGRFNAYPTWPSAAAACVAEVDRETGLVRVLRYCLVDDVGTIVNPRLVDANLHGATVQALGAALYEQIQYDDSGQLLTATLMDYTIPTAVEIPLFEIQHQTTPSPFTPFGTKGAGESGMGCALAALCLAVENAFPELDLRLTELPLTPSRVWQVIREAEGRSRSQHASDSVSPPTARRVGGVRGAR